MTILNNPYLLSAFLVVSNIAALSVLPKTEGFSKIVPTAFCLAAFAIVAWSLSRIVFTGVRLTTIVPLAAAVIPVATVVVGIVVHGEAASAARISLLAVACVLVGLASRV